MMSPRLLIAFVITASTFAVSTKLKGREIRYVSGSFSELHPGCTGRLDARDPKELLITCGDTNLNIPNSIITVARLVESKRDGDELHLEVEIPARNKGTQLVYIRTERETESSNWMLLEMPAKYARDVVVFLIRLREDRDAGHSN
jgi:hypothetical protein